MHELASPFCLTRPVRFTLDQDNWEDRVAGLPILELFNGCLQRTLPRSLRCRRCTPRLNGCGGQQPAYQKNTRHVSLFLSHLHSLLKDRLECAAGASRESGGGMSIAPSRKPEVPIGWQHSLEQTALGVLNNIRPRQLTPCRAARARQGQEVPTSGTVPPSTRQASRH